MCTFGLYSYWIVSSKVVDVTKRKEVVTLPTLPGLRQFLSQSPDTKPKNKKKKGTIVLFFWLRTEADHQPTAIVLVQVYLLNELVVAEPIAPPLVYESPELRPRDDLGGVKGHRQVPEAPVAVLVVALYRAAS
jgi:hypothetical protein